MLLLLKEICTALPRPSGRGFMRGPKVGFSQIYFKFMSSHENLIFLSKSLLFMMLFLVQYVCRTLSAAQ